MEYWLKRLLETQKTLSDKTIEETEKQLKSYYAKAMKSAISEFESTYDKLLTTVASGQAPTPADLYRLDKYWTLQGQIRNLLQNLGDSQISLLSSQFEKEFGKVYASLALPSQEAFATLSKEAVSQMINQIWCADGKSWSQRVWTNTDKLQQALNDGLLDCVVSGRTTGQLVKQLQQTFNVGYHRASTIARTEIAHIQTQSALERYKRYGVDEIEIFADPDNRTCPICSKLEGKRYHVNEPVPIPAHPNCRCCVLPVVDIEEPPEDESNSEEYLNFADNSGIILGEEPEKTPTPAPIPDNVQRAIDKVKELQKSNEQLRFYKRTKRHQDHAEELTGLSGDEAWAKYEEMASDFLKKDIDLTDMEGFMSSNDWLFKFEHSSGLFGILSDKGTISTLFRPDKEKYGKTPEEYWLQQIIDHGGN